MFEWRQPWYSLPTGWPNLDHKTTWDYSKTTENAWFVMAICEWCDLSAMNSQYVGYTIQVKMLGYATPKTQTAMEVAVVEM